MNTKPEGCSLCGSDDHDRQQCPWDQMTRIARDPRHTSKAKLTPPEPLPYVSRKALKRVKDWMPPPTVCNCCGGAVALVNNAAIYRGRSYGDWPYAYLCSACGAYVGLHPDTDLPLGTLANVDMREARKVAKEMFRRLIRRFFEGDRVPAYQWLAHIMQIEESVCHFAMFDVDRAELALAMCQAAIIEGSISNPDVFSEVLYVR